MPQGPRDPKPESIAFESGMTTTTPIDSGPLSNEEILAAATELFRILAAEEAEL